MITKRLATWLFKKSKYRLPFDKLNVMVTSQKSAFCYLCIGPGKLYKKYNRFIDFKVSNQNFNLRHKFVCI